MTIYMKTTKDEYELPVAVSDTLRGLAAILGVTPGCISSSISHKRKGYYKVEIEDDGADND